jgi:hypothetical protein
MGIRRRQRQIPQGAERVKSRTDHARSPVSRLRILALAQLDEKLGDLVLDLHAGENRGTVIGHRDVAVGRYQDLV